MQLLHIACELFTALTQVVIFRIIGALLISALRGQIQTAISSLITNALGRSLVPTNKVSQVALRQIFNGGLLGQLTAPAAASSGTNIIEQMAQQQLEQMLSSGQFEEMAMEFLSSGQLEQMVQDFMADPETEQMINECVLLLNYLNLFHPFQHDGRGDEAPNGGGGSHDDVNDGGADEAAHSGGDGRDGAG